MARQKRDTKTRRSMLDLFIVANSTVAIIGGLYMLYYIAFQQKITIGKPYLIYIFIIILGLTGFRFWLRERID